MTRIKRNRQFMYVTRESVNELLVACQEREVDKHYIAIGEIYSQRLAFDVDGDNVKTHYFRMMVKDMRFATET